MSPFFILIIIGQLFCAGASWKSNMITDGAVTIIVWIRLIVAAYSFMYMSTHIGGMIALLYIIMMILMFFFPSYFNRMSFKKVRLLHTVPFLIMAGSAILLII